MQENRIWEVSRFRKQIISERRLTDQEKIEIERVLGLGPDFSYLFNLAFKAVSKNCKATVGCTVQFDNVGYTLSVTHAFTPL